MLTKFARTDDLPAAAGLETGPDPWPLSRLQEALWLGQRMLIAVDDASRPVGYLLYDPQPRQCVVTRVVVGEGSRRAGVGRSMLEALHRRLPALGKDRVVTEVPDDRLDLHLWLKACGYKASTVENKNAYRFSRRKE